jgi:hypothetical protein
MATPPRRAGTLLNRGDLGASPAASGTGVRPNAFGSIRFGGCCNTMAAGARGGGLYITSSSTSVLVAAGSCVSVEKW